MNGLLSRQYFIRKN